MGNIGRLWLVLFAVYLASVDNFLIKLLKVNFY